MTPVKIRAWSCGFADDNEFNPPEVRGLSVRGTWPDGKRRRSSRVVEKLGPRTVRTRSGSVYELVGDPEPEYVAFCAEKGIPLNLDDPIRMVGREDTHRKMVVM